MINLTRKAADRFKVPYSELEAREGDFWRVDIVYVQRRKYLLCAHEVTLAVSLHQAARHRTLDSLFDALAERHPWYLGTRETGIMKGSNRRITGSMTDMKQMMEYMKDSTAEELEAFLYDTPYSCLPTNWSEREIESYRRNGGISADYLGALLKGKSEFELARMRFKNSE